MSSWNNGRTGLERNDPHATRRRAQRNPGRDRPGHRRSPGVALGMASGLRLRRHAQRPGRGARPPSPVPLRQLVRKEPAPRPGRSAGRPWPGKNAQGHARPRQEPDGQGGRRSCRGGRRPRRLGGIGCPLHRSGTAPGEGLRDGGLGARPPDRGAQPTIHGQRPGARTGARVAQRPSVLRRHRRYRPFQEGQRHPRPRCRRPGPRRMRPSLPRPSAAL